MCLCLLIYNVSDECACFCCFTCFVRLCFDLPAMLDCFILRYLHVFGHLNLHDMCAYVLLVCLTSVPVAC